LETDIVGLAEEVSHGEERKKMNDAYRNCELNPVTVVAARWW
jgi:hypothetical protein